MGYNKQFITGKSDILNALRRQDRMGVKQKKFEEKPKLNNADEYLMWYFFNNLGVSPENFIGTLNTVYDGEHNFRARRQRNIDFSRGRQFNEPVWDNEIGRTVSQYMYLQRRNIPILTYNVISKLVRSLVGQFREINTGNVVVCDSKDDRATEVAGILTQCVERAKKKNKTRNMDANNFKEMMLSGRPVFKSSWGSKSNYSKSDIINRVIGSDKFFMNPGVTDYNMEDLHLCGEVHDTALNRIVTAFSKGSYDRAQAIKEGYIKFYGNQDHQQGYSSQSFDGSQRRNDSFRTAGAGSGSYRYYEVWKELDDFDAITYDPLEVLGKQYKVHKYRDARQVKKEIDAINAQREEAMIGIDTDKDYLIRYSEDSNSRWYVVYLTPWGEVLDLRESPFKHGGHPYSFTNPDINGERWGIVEEVLDAQKSMDRQIRQADAIVANAIKGMIFIPDTAVPDEYDDKEYIEKVKSVDGAVVYKVRDGVEDLKPFQMYANSANVSGNVQQLIGLYSGLIDEISGNYGAAQGQSSANRTASGYALETQNAGLNVRDIMDNYLDVLVCRDEKILALVIEGYTKQDYLTATGKELDPRELQGLEFYIEQSKGTNSPAHRLALEQELLQLVSAQLLPFEVFLEVSNNPIMIQAKQKMEELQKRQQDNQAMMLEQQQAQTALQQGAMNPQEMTTSTRDQAIEQAGGNLIQQQPQV